MPTTPIKLFNCDLNYSYFDKPYEHAAPSAPQDWAFIDAEEYFNWHLEFGCNAAYCQAYTWSGYAFYPTRLGPVAPGPGQELVPKLFELARKAHIPFWSYFSVGFDHCMASVRSNWVIPTSRNLGFSLDFLAPESPWTDLLCARVREFLGSYPVDWLLFDGFVYGNWMPDFHVQPAWFVQEPFQEIIGRPMPAQAWEIEAGESLRYKREVLARQFRRIQDTVREASPRTKMVFNSPYREAAEPLWIDHPALSESDMLFAESSDEVVSWLLEVRKPHQRVMTTVIGRGGHTDPESWRKWHERGCDFFGYAWGAPPDFRPHRSYASQLEIVRRAFKEI